MSRRIYRMHLRWLIWLLCFFGWTKHRNRLEKIDMDGFTLKGNYECKDYEVRWKASELYSCHIEYEYLGKFGDCVDLNTLTDTFYIYPENCDFSVTKFALATEELYQHHLRQ